METKAQAPLEAIRRGERVTVTAEPTAQAEVPAAAAVIENANVALAASAMARNTVSTETGARAPGMAALGKNGILDGRTENTAAESPWVHLPPPRYARSEEVGTVDTAAAMAIKERGAGRNGLAAVVGVVIGSPAAAEVPGQTSAGSQGMSGAGSAEVRTETWPTTARRGCDVEPKHQRRGRKARGDFYQTQSYITLKMEETENEEISTSVMFYHLHLQLEKGTFHN